MGHCHWLRVMLSVGAFCASFILLLNTSRSSSMSLKPSGGGLRLEAWRIAGMSVEDSGVRLWPLFFSWTRRSA